MDKYRRNDDTNDDSGSYRGETPDDLSIISGESTPHQQTKVHGPYSTADKEWKTRYTSAMRKLSPKQKALAKLVMSGYSINSAAERMNIRQQTAQEYWDIIREKLS